MNLWTSRDLFPQSIQQDSTSGMSITIVVATLSPICGFAILIAYIIFMRMRDTRRFSEQHVAESTVVYPSRPRGSQAMYGWTVVEENGVIVLFFRQIGECAGPPVPVIRDIFLERAKQRKSLCSLQPLAFVPSPGEITTCVQMPSRYWVSNPCASEILLGTCSVTDKDVTLCVQTEPPPKRKRVW